MFFPIFILFAPIFSFNHILGLHRSLFSAGSSLLSLSSRGRLMERLARVFNNNLWQWLSVPLQEQLGISKNSWN
ncbi:hypothetical protein Csa_003278 [Cucumis sativus]|uniref:Uncharacterized protein n=1 Tax=Cucumis sativus TaxID=3659 RepID=A0A0A0KKT8_CUCSA|nr:hypothetical protein Csa_003278 [Cucumis sativus]